jgi:hypothetical protein
VTIVVFVLGAIVSGVLRFALAVSATLKYDPVELRNVQNVPAVVGSGVGNVSELNPEFAM